MIFFIVKDKNGKGLPSTISDNAAKTYQIFGQEKGIAPDLMAYGGYTLGSFRIPDSFWENKSIIKKLQCVVREAYTTHVNDMLSGENQQAAIFSYLLIHNTNKNGWPSTDGIPTDRQSQYDRVTEVSKAYIDRVLEGGTSSMLKTCFLVGLTMADLLKQVYEDNLVEQKTGRILSCFNGESSPE